VGGFVVSAKIIAFVLRLHRKREPMHLPLAAFSLGVTARRPVHCARTFNI
jgi:hypothetical protein